MIARRAHATAASLTSALLSSQSTHQLLPHLLLTTRQHAWLTASETRILHDRRLRRLKERRAQRSPLHGPPGERITALCAGGSGSQPLASTRRLTLREPARVVAHRHSGDERLPQARGQADERVAVERGLGNGQLVLAELCLS